MANRHQPSLNGSELVANFYVYIYNNRIVLTQIHPIEEL